MKFRSFLAFDLPDGVRQNLARMVSLVSEKASEVTWVKPSHFHGTVKFFGEVEETLLMNQITRVIEEELSKQKPFELEVVGLGVYPNWRYPRVIWAGLAGKVEDISELHQRLEVACAPFGIPADERTFRLHLTLGRAKSKLKHAEHLVSFVEKQVGYAFGTLHVDCLTLYRSVLTKEGPVYTPLKQFHLDGK